MRHILLLLIGFFALGASLPAPAPAEPVHHGIHRMMPASHCPAEQHGLVHVHGCLGCACEAAGLPAVPDRTPLLAVLPVPAAMPAIEGLRPDFEPPPPRRVG